MKLILEKNSDILNLKSHSLIKTFYEKEQLEILSFEEIKNYLLENKNNTINIFFYIYINWNFGFDLINFLKNDYQKQKPNIFVFTDDYWNTGSNIKYLNSIFKTNNCYQVIHQCPNLDILKKYTKSITIDKKNLIFNPFWCCYDSSYLPENNNVINKLLVSGRTWEKIYQERFLISKIKGTKILNYQNIEMTKINFDSFKNYFNNINNDYAKELNKYLACFSSSVYNTHCILLKTFEILAVGSLLVMPKHEEEFLKKIGLINMHNCWLINFNKDLQKQVDKILHPRKRYLVDAIRRNGHQHAIKYLNSEKKFLEISQLI